MSQVSRLRVLGWFAGFLLVSGLAFVGGYLWNQHAPDSFHIFLYVLAGIAAVMWCAALWEIAKEWGK